MNCFYLENYQVLEGEVQKETPDFYYINNKRKRKSNCFKTRAKALDKLLFILKTYGVVNGGVYNLRDSITEIIEFYPELFL